MDNLWVWVLVLATPFAFLYVLILSKWRFSKEATVIITALCIAAITIMNYFTIRDMSWMVAEKPMLDLACRALNITLEYIFALIFTKQSRAQTAFIVLSMCLCVYIVDTIAITMDLWIGSDLVSLLFKLALYIFMAFVLYRLRKTFWEIAAYMRNRLWMLCVVQAVLFVCSTLVISYPIPLNLSPGNIPLALMICIANISVYGIFLYIFRLIHRQSALENNAEAFHIYTTSLEQQNSIITKNAEKAALFRHDIRHVSQMMSACAGNEDLEGVKELISLLDKNVSAGGGLVVKEITGHKLLDTLLNSYIKLAEESGIDILINIADAAEIQPDLTEFAVVLANAFENAINACKKQKLTEMRLIRIYGYKKGKQYFMEIVNTFSGIVQFDDKSGLPVSTEAGHGTGVKSIAYFAEKYGAELMYRTEGNWFYMGMLMNTAKM